MLTIDLLEDGFAFDRKVTVSGIIPMNDYWNNKAGEITT